MRIPLLIASISVFLIISCSSNDRNESGGIKKHDTTETKTALVQQKNYGYDSVKYFKDVSWPTLIGIDPVSDKDLSHPYVGFLYKKDTIDIQTHFNETRVKTFQLKKYRGRWYDHSSHYLRDFQDTMHRYSFYDEEGQTSFSCLGNPFTSATIECRGIWRIKGIDKNQLMSKSFRPAFGTRKVSLADILSFDQNKLRTIFEKYHEEIISIENKKLYVTYQKSMDFKDKKEEVNNEKLVRVPDFKFQSFFYYYSDMF